MYLDKLLENPVFRLLQQELHQRRSDALETLINSDPIKEPGQIIRAQACIEVTDMILDDALLGELNKRAVRDFQRGNSEPEEEDE